MKYRISTLAIEDLEKIWLYTQQKWSNKQANMYISLIFEEIKYLTKNPYSGKCYYSNNKLFRSYPIKAHILFYQINSSEDTLEVIRIFHKMMDIDNRLIK